MKRILFWCLVFSIISCSTKKNSPIPGVHEILKPHYAKGFEIHKTDSSTYILLFDLESPGDTVQVIPWKTPAKRIACKSSTHVAIIDKLGQTDKIVAASFADMLRNPRAQKLFADKKIINLTTGEEVDKELLLSSSPDVLFGYPFENNDDEKLAAKGMEYVQVSEYLEVHPLGRAEWIKVFGVILGLEEKADSIFKEIESRYLQTRELASIAGDENRPDVFTTSYNGVAWFVPPGNSFQGTWIQDAGGDYVFKDSTGTKNISLSEEELIEVTSHADFWGEVIYDPDTTDGISMMGLNEKYHRLKPQRIGSLFYCNAFEKDYFGEAIMEPDVILKDLAAIFHPEVFPGHVGVYFRVHVARRTSQN